MAATRKRRKNKGGAGARRRAAMASVELFSRAPMAGRARPAAAGQRRASITITGGFSLVDALIEGYAMPLAPSSTKPNTVEGERMIKVDGIISINLRFVSVAPTVVKAEVTLDGAALNPPIYAELPAGDTGYVSFFRTL